MDRRSKKSILMQKGFREREYMETSCMEQCRNGSGTADTKCTPCVSYTWIHKLPFHSLNYAVF